MVLSGNDSRLTEEHNDNPKDALLILGSEPSSIQKRTKCTDILHVTPLVREQLVKMLYKPNR